MSYLHGVLHPIKGAPRSVLLNASCVTATRHECRTSMVHGGSHPIGFSA